MTEILKNLYAYLLEHKNESLTEIDCIGTVDGVTTENVVQLLESLQDDGKVSLNHDYIHYDITVF